MADIFQVCGIVEAICDGFEECVMGCLDEHRQEVVQAIYDQLYSGLSGDGSQLSPNYDNDPFFEEPGRWYHRSEEYKAWKLKITPPQSGEILDTPPRPINIPNLIITGEQFYDKITAVRTGGKLVTNAEGLTAEVILKKWGDNILQLGNYAKDYLCFSVLLPRIRNYVSDCGW